MSWHLSITVYFDNLVDRKINDPEYMLRLAKKVRPFMIFDQDEIIDYDLGATAFIDSLRIKDKKIYVYFNTYFQIAPLLEPVGSYVSYYGYTSKRGKGNIWVFTIIESGFDTFDKYKLRLEILR